MIHRDWCPNCRKAVEQVIAEALPKTSVGNGILLLSEWLHFALGNTISQIVEVFNFHLQLKISPGGLVHKWRHQNELFTFLQNADVPFDNNFGERSIRGAVIMRKNSYNNISRRAVMTQSVLMSVFFTIKQRGLNPVDTVKKALKIYIKTGNLPRLAEFATSNG